MCHDLQVFEEIIWGRYQKMERTSLPIDWLDKHSIKDRFTKSNFQNQQNPQKIQKQFVINLEMTILNFI